MSHGVAFRSHSEAVSSRLDPSVDEMESGGDITNTAKTSVTENPGEKAKP